MLSRKIASETCMKSFARPFARKYGKDAIIKHLQHVLKVSLVFE